MRPKEEREKTSNPTVYNRRKRLDLKCSICPPNKGDNANRCARHGAKKPKYKSKRQSRGGAS